MLLRFLLRLTSCAVLASAAWAAEEDPVLELVNESVALKGENKHAEALNLLRKAVALPNSAKSSVLVAKNHLAMTLAAQGRLEDSFHVTNEVLKEVDEVFKDHPGELASSLINCSSVYTDAGHPDKGEALAKRALEIVIKSPNPALAVLISGYIEYADALSKLRRWGEAIALYRAAHQLAVKVRGPRSPDAVSLSSLLCVALMGSYGKEQQEASLNEAAKLTTESMDILKADGMANTGSMGVLMTRLGSIKIIRGDLDEAEKLLREAISIHTGFLPETQESLNYSFSELTALLVARNRPTDLEILSQTEAQRVIKEHGAESAAMAALLQVEGAVHQALNLPVEAENLYWNAMKMRETTVGPNDPAVARSLLQVALLVTARGDDKNPESMLRRCLKILGDHSGNGSDETQQVRYLLLTNLLKQGKLEAARKVVEEGCQADIHFREQESTWAGQLRLALGLDLMARDQQKEAMMQWDKAMDAMLHRIEVSDYPCHSACSKMANALRDKGKPITDIEPILAKGVRRIHALPADFHEGDELSKSWSDVYRETLAAANIDLKVIEERLTKLLAGDKLDPL